MDMIDVNVPGIKGGDDLFNLSLGRHPTAKQLMVRVKVHPIIESFVKNLGNGQTREVSVYGKLWLPAVDGGSKLEIYNMTPIPENNTYQLDMVGGPLIDENGITNLSFLRLVGLSKGEGCQFHVAGVYSESRLIQIGDAIGAGIDKLYKDYLSPVEFSVVVSVGRGR